MNRERRLLITRFAAVFLSLPPPPLSLSLSLTTSDSIRSRGNDAFENLLRLFARPRLSIFSQSPMNSRKFAEQGWRLEWAFIGPRGFSVNDNRGLKGRWG